MHRPGQGHSHGHHSSLSAEQTVKRLDFEDIPVINTMATDPQETRAQALKIRRDLERCREDMPNPTELIESLKAAATEYADVDTSKLWEEYLHLKREFLQVEAENLFLESLLEPGESAQEDVTESELHAMEKQLADIRAMSARKTQEIKSLIGTFAAEIENFPRLVESALNHFDECDEKIWLLEDQTEKTPPLNTMVDADLERRAHELATLAGNMEIEALRLDEETSKKEEYYKHLQSSHEMHTKLDLLSKVLTFFSDWSVDGYENDVVSFTFRSSVPKLKKATQNKHQKPVKEVPYKLRVKVHPKTLGVENAQLEPKNEALIHDTLKEMVFRRMMHAVEVSPDAHNDLEFLLRRVGQWIFLRKSNA